MPEFVNGENFHLFSSLRIPLGEGLSGWVAQNNKAILNGNPSVEPGYLNDPAKYSTLRSALAVPLAGASGVVAVLALYRAGQDAFTAEDLRVVETMSAAVGTTVDSAGKTIYIYKPDGSSTTSKVPAALKAVWPAVTTMSTTAAVGAGLTASEVAVNSAHQVAYNHHLLYTFKGDTKAGTAT